MRVRAVGYVRVGDKDEDAYQNLAGRQIDVIAGWTAANEADVLDWYFDIGVDAAEPFQLRSGGILLLDRVSRGDVTHVVVGSLEVLGKGRALLNAVEVLFTAKKGLGIITVLPGPHDVAEPDEAVDFPRLRADGSRTLKAA